MPVETKKMLDDIGSRHSVHYGKIVQKLLALTFQRMGFEIPEVRCVEGVDIDMIHPEKDLRYSLEVKTGQDMTIQLADKDVQGLERRKKDGYETFYAVLCKPLCVCEGWIIFPSDGVPTGRLSPLRYCRTSHKELCREANSVFPRVVEEAYPLLIACQGSDGLQVLRERFGI